MAGQSETAEGEYTTNNEYVVNLQANIDPFELLQLLKLEKIDISAAETQEMIINIVKNLGYLRLTIDETTEGNAHNVFTLLADLNGNDAQVALYVTVNSPVPEIIAQPVCIGGVFSVEEIAEAIFALVNKGTAQADGSIDISGILDTVKEILAFTNIDLNNLAAIKDGMRIDVDGLVKYVCGLLNADLTQTIPGFDMTIEELIGNVMGGNTHFNITVPEKGLSYGKADTSFGIDDITAKSITTFSVNGTVTTSASAEAAANKTYNIAINGDIDLGALLGLAKGTDTDNIIDVIKNLGYLSATVIKSDGEHVLDFVAELDGDDAEVALYFTLGGNDMRVGDVFKVDTIADLVKGLVNGTPAAAQSEAVTAAPSFDTVGLAIVALISLINSESDLDLPVKSDWENDLTGSIISTITGIVSRGGFYVDINGILDGLNRVLNFVKNMLPEGAVDLITGTVVPMIKDMFNLESNGCFTVAFDDVNFGTADKSVTIESLEPADNLTFTLNGDAKLVNDADSSVAGYYDISVNADLNLSALFNLLNGTDKENIVATLKQLGYLSVVVNEVTVDGQFLQNIITIHSNFEDGELLLNVNAYAAVAGVVIPKDITLGQLYEFDALISFIENISTAGTAAEGEEGGIDVLGLIKQLLGYTNINDIAEIKEIGFEFKIKKALTALLNQLGINSNLIDLSPVYKKADVLNVRLDDVVYGEYEEVALDKLDAVVHRGDDITGDATVDNKDRAGSGASGFFTDFTGIKDWKDVVYDARILPGVGATITVLGTDLQTGKPGEFKGKVIAIEGLDASKIGEKQTVTFYFKDGAHKGSNLISILDEFVELPEWVEQILFGIQSVSVDVTISDYDAEKEFTISGLNEEKEAQLFGNEDWFNDGIRAGYSAPVLTIDGQKYTLTKEDAIITKDGVDVTADVLANGMKSGTYKVTIGIGQYRSEEYTIQFVNSFINTSSSSHYYGNVFNGFVTLVIDGVEYDVVYENNKFVAKSESGEAADLQSLNVTWLAEDGTAVVINEKGYIANYPEVTKSTAMSNIIYVTAVLGDGTKLSKNLSARNLYVSDQKSAKIGGSIDAYVKYVDKIGYVVDGKTVKLEFRYDETDKAFGMYYKNDADAYVKASDITVGIKVFEITAGEDGDVIGTTDVFSTVVVDGKLAKAGTYRFEYSVEYNGSAQNFFHKVIVKAAE